MFMAEYDIMNLYKQCQQLARFRPWKRYTRDGEITCFKNKNDEE